MPKIKERILNKEDLVDKEEEKKQETKKVTNLQEYGEIRVPKTWAKPPALADLQHDINYAIIEHNEVIKDIDEYLGYYHTTPGIGRPHKIKGRSNAQPQSIRKAAEWRYASLSEPFLDSPDLFKGKPSTAQDTAGTREAQLVLNYQMRNQIGLVDFIDDYIKDAVDIGTVIVRTSWEEKEISRQGEVEVVKYEEDPELAQPYAELLNLMETEPATFNAKVPEGVKVALRKSLEQNKSLRRIVVKTETETFVETVKNQPKLEVCDYRDVIPDPTCVGIQKDMKFCGFRLRTTKAELMDDPRYFNVEDIIVTPLVSAQHEETFDDGNNGEESDQDSDTFQFKDPNRQPIVGMEYWGYVDVSGDGSLTSVVYTWFGNVLVRAEENPYPDKEIPFTFVSYLKKRNSLYGEPDGVLLQEDQKVSGAITRGVVDILAKNANGQRGIPKGALDYTNLGLFRAGKDFEFNSVAQIGRDGIAQVTKFPEIPVSALQIQQLAENNIKEMTGTQQGAGSQSHGDALGTAGDPKQVAGITKAARRELGILRRLSNGIIEVGKKVCAMNTEFLEEEEIIRVTDGSFAQIKRSNLDCKYDLSLSISTAEDDATKAQELSFMLQTSSAVMDEEFTRGILADISDLRRMPEKAEMYRSFKPKPDPIEEELKRLAVAKLQAEIEEIQSRTQENLAEAAREAANAEKMRADAQLALSKADAIDLKYVEDETGVSHQRKLDERQAQAQGNIKLETHKANLEKGKEEKPIDNLQENLTSPPNKSTNSPIDDLPVATPQEEPATSTQSSEQFLDELNQIGAVDELLNPKS